MAQPDEQDTPPEEQRKAIFRALVEAQDQAMSVAASRKLITERFGVTDRELREIEREGIEEQWPPL